MYFKIKWFLQTLWVRLFLQKIGLLSYVGNPLSIHGGKRITIGNKVRIFPGSRMETHHGGTIVFGDDISIGQNLHIISSGLEFMIEKKTTMSANVFMTNIDHDYTDLDVHILQQKYVSKPTHIGENCFIGFGAAIQAGTILGKQCIVGANSVVRGTFPDYCVIVGAPAKIVKRYNVETKTWQKTDANGTFI